MTLIDMPGHLIRRLHQISTQIFQHHIQQAGYDITPVQFAAMAALHTNPGIEQAQIASMIAYDRATIGGVIDRLEQKGYVLRIVSNKDRRAREVSLTKEGEHMYQLVFPIIHSLQPEILHPLTDLEQEQLTSLLQKVVNFE
jgi:MarR family transcriptional regulator, temperature-dependent positive regulator of motility